MTQALSSLQSSRALALVTGSTDGIGVTTAKHLLKKGYNVVVHGRDPQRIKKACETIRAFAQDSEGSVYSVLADIETVRGSEKLALEVKDLCETNDLQLKILMNNAGVYAEKLKITADGTEETFAVNVVAPFVITSLLLPTLLKQPSRIVIASSISQSSSIRHWDDVNYKKRPFSAHGSYSESKLFDAMLSKEFAERLQEAGYGTDQITCNCLDPGTVNTKMLLAGWGPCGINVGDALGKSCCRTVITNVRFPDVSVLLASDQTWLCTSSEVGNVTGQYFVGRSSRGSRDAYKPDQRAKLWKILSELAPDAAAIWNFDWREQP